MVGFFAVAVIGVVILLNRMKLKLQLYYHSAVRIEKNY